MKGEFVKNEKEGVRLDKRKDTENMSKLDDCNDEVRNYELIPYEWEFHLILLNFFGIIHSFMFEGFQSIQG